MSKHARVSPVRRLLVGGALAAATTAGALALAAPASAAPSHDWSGVAQCESGGNWHINTGNGYFGGLQFSQSTWAGYGGTSYAARADLASPAQQVDIAERVLAGQGIGAWPVCGRHLAGGSTAVADSAPAPAPAPTRASGPAVSAPAAPAASSSGGTYVVRSGDTLAKIARAHGTSWRTLWQENRSTVANPNRIYVGQTLSV